MAARVVRVRGFLNELPARVVLRKGADFFEYGFFIQPSMQLKQLRLLFRL